MHSCWPPSLSWSLRSGPWPRRKSRLPLPVWRSFPPSPASRSAWSNFNRQNDRNQAFNHAGNMVGAAVSGYLGWKFGFGAVIILAAVFGALSIISVLIIPKKAIDDHVARGSSADSSREPASAWRVLLECKPLLVLAAALALFHLGNAAMLPLYGLAVVSGQEGNGAGFVALTIVVAQAVMIVASVVAVRMAEKEGYWLVLLISFIA